MEHIGKEPSCSRGFHVAETHLSFLTTLRGLLGPHLPHEVVKQAESRKESGPGTGSVMSEARL